VLKPMLLKLFGAHNDRFLKQLRPLVTQIKQRDAGLGLLPDEVFPVRINALRGRLQDGASLDSLLPETFALVREAAFRALGMRHYDVQILGGIVLHRGNIAEMKTGEGKTLTATLPIALNALAGKGVHVVTVNDYLARRDAEWMGPIFRLLGFTVGVVLPGQNPAERRAAYACDITYATNNELGFDYLRDNMRYDNRDRIQRGFHYALVDEIDSVLIDEARTPLIISGPAEVDMTTVYQKAAEVIKNLVPEVHYQVHEREHQALLTEAGISVLEQTLDVGNLYDPEHIALLHCLNQSLRGRHLFRRQRDYIVNGKEVVIVDANTGREMKGRRYSDGLHQALEALEGVPVQPENQTLASITFQNYFRMYDKLAGMTGTARTEEAEFSHIYNLEVVTLPTNKPSRRQDWDDRIYVGHQEKLAAVVEEVARQNATGRPILVGTIAIETSEVLSTMLTRRGLRHKVLNARFHDQEAEIIAQAGRVEAITIATNMAGRGTDILLGGNPEMLAQRELAQSKEADARDVKDRWQQRCAEEKAKVLRLGGLCILGTERHESRRIDNQLRGRAGRQGDPGSTRFFLSLQDKLMRVFGSDGTRRLLEMNMKPDEPIEHRLVSRTVERTQKTVEGHNFEMRKRLLAYDEVKNKQRTAYYNLRNEVLNGAPRVQLYARIKSIIHYATAQIGAVTSRDKAARQNQLQFLSELFGLEDLKAPDPFRAEAFAAALYDQVSTAYAARYADLGLAVEQVADKERAITLSIMDRHWKEYLQRLDYLEKNVALQAYINKDPLVEFKTRSFAMFNELLDHMDEDVVRITVSLRPVLADPESIRQQEKARLAGLKHNGKDQS